MPLALIKAGFTRKATAGKRIVRLIHAKNIKLSGDFVVQKPQTTKLKYFSFSSRGLGLPLSV